MTAVDNIAISSNSVVFAVLGLSPITSQHPYVVKGITGLDAEEIIPITIGMSESGNKYSEMLMESRDVAILMSLRPRLSMGETYQSLRDEFYKTISASRSPKVTLHFRNSDEEVRFSIDGYISKLEASLFVKSPELQITIRCDDPLFKAPLSSEGFTQEGVNLFIETTDATAPSGIEAVIYIHDSIDHFGFADLAEEWEFRVNYDFVAGDIIHFSSVHGSKRLELERPSFGSIPLAPMMAAGSIWPMVFPGENAMSVLAPFSAFGIDRFEYYPTYWGL